MRHGGPRINVLGRGCIRTIRLQRLELWSARAYYIDRVNVVLQVNDATSCSPASGFESHSNIAQCSLCVLLFTRSAAVANSVAILLGMRFRRFRRVTAIGCMRVASWVCSRHVVRRDVSCNFISRVMTVTISVLMLLPDSCQ